MDRFSHSCKIVEITCMEAIPKKYFRSEVIPGNLNCLYLQHKHLFRETPMHSPAGLRGGGKVGAARALVVGGK